MHGPWVHRGIVRAINAITLPEKGSSIGGGEGTTFVAREVWAKVLQRGGPGFSTARSTAPGTLVSAKS